MSRSFLRWWGPLILYMGIVFWLSSRSRLDMLATLPDYVLHAGAYFVMAILAVRAIARGLTRPASRAALSGGVAIAILYGVSDEWHQSRVPGRVASWPDVLADGVGAVGAGAALGIFWRFRRITMTAPPRRDSNP